jgi:transposase
MKADTLLADKAFDADQCVIKPLEAVGYTCVIPSKSNRRDPRPFDKEIYKARHLIEDFSAASSASAPSQLDTTRPPSISSRQSTSLPLSLGSIEDKTLRSICPE